LLPISPDLVERIECAALAGNDVLGGLAPDEGLRLGVVLQQVVVDRAFEIVDAGVAATSNALCRDLGEEALHEVHPGRAGGREMQLETGMLFQPGLHLGRLVGGVVVEDQVDVAGFFHGPVDAAQETQELLGTVTRHAFPDYEARLDVQRGEERGGAIALVVVGHRGRAPLLQRQPRLGPIQRLDLGFLIDAKYDRAIRRIEIEADDLGDLFLEQRVVRDLEPFHDVRLQPGIGPYAPHAGGRYTHRFCHRGAAPMRGIGRGLLHGLRDHLQPDLSRKRRHPRGPRLVALEAGHAFIEIPLLTAPDRRLRHASPTHDRNGACAVSGRHHDVRPPSQLTRRITVGAQSFKLSAVGWAKVKADVRASHPPFMTRLSRIGNPMSGVEH